MDHANPLSDCDQPNNERLALIYHQFGQSPRRKGAAELGGFKRLLIR
ncbi:hypothetical protein COXBURSA334_1642 [Coxiella burnetii Q321]|nr:hypothetical protein COXBURSA334_1642 [Coxiella burnetii Q321]